MDEEFESEDEAFHEGELEELDEEHLAEEDLEEEADLEEDVEVLEEEEDIAVLEEEEPDSDEVEATLDQILEERVGVRAGLEEEEDEDFDEPVEDRAASIGVSPKRPGEFTCRSCFLVKHRSQLADTKRVLCRDCI